MKQFILQIETCFRLNKDVENKYFSTSNPIILTKSQVLIEFKNWIDSLILKIIPAGSSYPFEDRFQEITEIDYNSKDELYTFFTSFLDSHSLTVLSTFIKSLIDIVYTWPAIFESTIDSFYEEIICQSHLKNKFNINYPRLKLNSSLSFFEV